MDRARKSRANLPGGGFPFSSFVRASRGADSRGVAGRRVPRVPACRSRESSGLADALPACAFSACLARQAEHLLENHRDVRHQVDRIVVHDDLPGKIDASSACESLARSPDFRLITGRDCASERTGAASFSYWRHFRHPFVAANSWTKRYIRCARSTGDAATARSIATSFFLQCAPCSRAHSAGFLSSNPWRWRSPCTMYRRISSLQRRSGIAARFAAPSRR